jgi:hypothetical protein
MHAANYWRNEKKKAKKKKSKYLKSECSGLLTMERRAQARM